MLRYSLFSRRRVSSVGFPVLIDVRRFMSKLYFCNGSLDQVPFRFSYLDLIQMNINLFIIRVLFYVISIFLLHCTSRLLYWCSVNITNVGNFLESFKFVFCAWCMIGVFFFLTTVGRVVVITLVIDFVCGFCGFLFVYFCLFFFFDSACCSCHCEILTNNFPE